MKTLLLMYQSVVIVKFLNNNAVRLTHTDLTYGCIGISIAPYRGGNNYDLWHIYDINNIEISKYYLHVQINQPRL